MSDVPRTDAAKRWMSGFADEWVPRYVCEQIERELNEAKSRIALQDMNMACIDDIVNGDHREGMTPDTMLVPMLRQRLQTLADQRDEARECLREMLLASRESGNIRTAKSVGKIYTIEDADGRMNRWRKAAGLD